MNLFRRPATHYGKTPQPETPYQRAAQVWDERIGSARVQAKNWRIMAFGSLFLSAGFAAALVIQSARGTVVPWVVQVDNLGHSQAVAPATADYRPTDPQIAWHLARFIEQVRSIPADPVIVRQNWLRAYEWTTDRGAGALNDYARANDPFTRVGRQQIAVEVSSVIRASNDSFRVAWTEVQNALLQKMMGLSGCRGSVISIGMRVALNAAANGSSDAWADTRRSPASLASCREFWLSIIQRPENCTPMKWATSDFVPMSRKKELRPFLDAPTDSLLMTPATSCQYTGPIGGAFPWRDLSLQAKTPGFQARLGRPSRHLRMRGCRPLSDERRRRLRMQVGSVKSPGNNIVIEPEDGTRGFRRFAKDQLPCCSHNETAQEITNHRLAIPMHPGDLV